MGLNTRSLIVDTCEIEWRPCEQYDIAKRPIGDEQLADETSHIFKKQDLCIKNKWLWKEISKQLPSSVWCLSIFIVMNILVLSREINLGGVNWNGIYIHIEFYTRE